MKFFGSKRSHVGLYIRILLRVIISLVFMWLGALKIFGYDPTSETVSFLYPLITNDISLIIFGVIEIFIGISIVTKRFRVANYIALTFFLIGSIFPFIQHADLLFKPTFPLLSTVGQAVLSNTVLIVAGLYIFIDSKRQRL